ncbi:hypothetical protein D3C84_952760 [compost metagenome]
MAYAVSEQCMDSGVGRRFARFSRSTASPPTRVRIPIPSARDNRESHNRGASRPAATAVMASCRKVWHEAATPAL